MSHPMTCVDVPNCTWTDMAMPTLVGVNCAKHWEESIKQYIEDSMKKGKILSKKIMLGIWVEI